MSFRRDFISKPIFSWARGVLPAMSDTEREALEAGDVWWDADLFTGNPDWTKLLATAPATLTEEERAFLNGPVDELCAMLDDWKINWEWRDLPPEAWDFIKRHKFFGMIIPKDFGGLGFSPYAHSEVVRKLSSRSLTAAVTVMVPNSLGPGELLMRFGTSEQQQKWLPRLADGRVDGRHRRHLQGQFRGPRGARPAAELAQALYYARSGLDTARPRLQGV
jgi:acyl-CoA dehydrogenase